MKDNKFGGDTGTDADFTTANYTTDDMLKIIDKLETLEQWIINLDYVIKDSKNRIKELELKGAK
jgi:hypothetical protein